jgi:hypothetical protein
MKKLFHTFRTCPDGAPFLRILNDGGKCPSTPASLKQLTMGISKQDREKRARSTQLNSVIQQARQALALASYLSVCHDAPSKLAGQDVDHEKFKTENSGKTVLVKCLEIFEFQLGQFMSEAGIWGNFDLRGFSLGTDITKEVLISLLSGFRVLVLSNFLSDLSIFFTRVSGLA